MPSSLLVCERDLLYNYVVVNAYAHGEPLRLILDTTTSHSTLRPELVAMLDLPVTDRAFPLPAIGGVARYPAPEIYRLDYLVVSGGGWEHRVTDLDLLASDHLVDWYYDGVLGMSFIEKFDEVGVDLRVYDAPVIHLSWR